MAARCAAWPSEETTLLLALGLRLTAVAVKESSAETSPDRKPVRKILSILAVFLTPRLLAMYASVSVSRRTSTNALFLKEAQNYIFCSLNHAREQGVFTKDSSSLVKRNDSSRRLESVCNPRPAIFSRAKSPHKFWYLSVISHYSWCMLWYIHPGQDRTGRIAFIVFVRLTRGHCMR